MDERLKDLRNRVESLEKQLRRGRLVRSIFVLVIAALWCVAWTTSVQQPKVIRARTAIVEDEQGRERVILGAPVPDIKGGGRISPSVGLVINDADGLERFAVGLQANGRMVMGFDAPPGSGDPRNRERINIVADATGGAYLRFLNRKTFVAGRLVLDDR